MTRLFLSLILLSTPAPASPSVTVAFSPDAGATEAVVQRRGVTVQAVIDPSNETARYIAATFLVHGGIPTRIDSRYALMHDKFIVVDGKTVQTGSFNYTAAAEHENAENVLILRDSQDVAARYEAEWHRLWAESKEYPVGEMP